MKAYDLVVIAMLGALAAVFQIVHGVIGIPTGFGMTVDLVAVPVILAFFLFGLEHSLWVLLIASFVITLIAPDSWLGASMKFMATIPMVLVPAFYILARNKKVSFAILGGVAFVAALLMFVASGCANKAMEPVLTPLNQTAFYSVPQVNLFETELIHGTDVTASTLMLGIIPILALTVMTVVLLIIWKTFARKLNPKPFANSLTIVAVLFAALAVRGVASIISNYYYAGPIFFGMAPEELMKIAPWFIIAGWNAVQGILEFGIAWVIAYQFGFAKKYGEWKSG